MRYSNNETNAAGDLVNGYDYTRQCWIIDGLVAECGHPQRQATCYACNNAGLAPALEIDNAGEIARPIMNTYNVEILIGDVYRVTVNAPTVAAAELLALDIDVNDDTDQHTYDVTIVDSDRRVTHVAVTGGAGK